MRLFPCPRCGNVVHFEDLSCQACGQAVAFSHDTGVHRNGVMVPLTDGAWQDPSGVTRRGCENAPIGCNWLAQPGERLCFACLLTRRVPGEIDQRVTKLLADTSEAKRRLVFQLRDLSLPIVSHRDQPDGGLAFDLDATTDDKKVMIGHLNGVITIDVTEAQDSHREALRVLLDEPYRTMLGHFRHEIGHYYWQVLVVGHPDWLERFRATFGDERQDYGTALDAHYADAKAAAPWQETFISQYATTHPWEDFAETFAHFLHITDTLQTVAAHGLQLQFPSVWPGEVRARNTTVPRLEAAAGAGIAEIVRTWEPLAGAFNRVNLSMGKSELYPFTISEGVLPKLGFVLDLVRAFGSPRLQGV